MKLFLDETWYNCSDVKKGWDDGSCCLLFKSTCVLWSTNLSTTCRIRDDQIRNYLYVSSKNIGDSKADSRDEMSSNVSRTILKRCLPRYAKFY